MKVFRIFILIAGIALLAACGFLGARLYVGGAFAQVLRPLGLANAPAQKGGGGGGEVIVLDQGAGPVRITFSDPSDLPKEQPVTFGLFLRKQDNSLFLGTGNIEVNAEVVNGDASLNAKNDGPEIEVVVTGDTIVYEDITEAPVIGPEDVKKGEMVVPRKVKRVDNLDALGDNMVIRVWGEKTGDRVIARVIYYDRVGVE